MVKLAIAEYPYFRFSDFEISRTGNTYTGPDFTALKRSAYPEHTFYFIVGADSPVPH